MSDPDVVGPTRPPAVAGRPLRSRRGATESGDRRRRRRGRRLGRVVLVLAAAALAVLIADLLVTGLVERRVARQLTEAVGRPLDVEVATPLAVIRMLASNGFDVVVEDRGRERGTLRARLTDVTVDEGLRALLGRTDDWRLAAPRARVEATVRAGASVPGSFVVVAYNATVERRGETWRLDAPTVQASAPDNPARVRARAEGVSVRLVGGSAVPARLELRRLSIDTLQRGTLGVPAATATLRLTRARGRGQSLTAHGGTLEATDLTVAGGDAEGTTFRRFEADLPGVSLERRRPQCFVVATRGGHFTAELEEEVANELWRSPGRIEFERNDGALVLGRLRIGFEVEVEGDAVVLAPRVPAVVARFTSVRIAPALPAGTTLTGASLQRGRLVVEGDADSLQVPDGCAEG